MHNRIQEISQKCRLFLLPKPLVVTSSCLLGEKVRYDGTAKPVPDLIAFIGSWLELQSVCPEMAVGLGVPRPTIERRQLLNAIEIVEVETPSQKHTTAFTKWFNTISLSGYSGALLKARSPSCGVGNTLIHQSNVVATLGNGVWAEYLQTSLAPEVMMCEDAPAEHWPNWVVNILIWQQWQHAHATAQTEALRAFWRQSFNNDCTSPSKLCAHLALN